MKYLPAALCAAALAVATGSCIIVVDETGRLMTHAAWEYDWHGEAIRGSGQAATESREVADFHRIELRGSADAIVHVGATKGVSVTADDNLISKVTTTVEDGALIVGMERGNFRCKTDIVIEIGMPALEKLSLSGSGDVAIDGLAGSDLELSISGAGDLQATGTVEHLTATVSGAGDMDLYGLTARNAKVKVSGAGDVEVTVLEKLEVTVSGAGDVNYRGTPQVDKHISGAGSVSRG